MDRRTFCGVTALSLSAGCLQLEAEDDDEQPAAEQDEADETDPSDELTSLSDVELEAAWSFDELLRAVFASDGSFWGIADYQLLQVDTDGTIEWESERVADDVPLTTFDSSAFDGRNVAVADERIVVGSRDYDDPVAAIYAFDADTGSLQWSMDLDPETDTDQIRLEQVAYGVETVVSILQDEGGRDRVSRLRAVESSTGDVRWDASLDESTAYYLTAVDGQFLVSTDDGIVAYDPQTGEQTDPSAIDVACRRPHAPSGPGTLCISTSDGVATVDLEARETIWTADRSRLVTNVTADETSVYAVDTGGYVHAYDLETGDERWDTRLEIERVASGGFASSGDVLWASGTDGSLSGLATANGDPVYRDTLDEFGFHLAALDDRLVTSAGETVASDIETSGV